MRVEDSFLPGTIRRWTAHPPTRMRDSSYNFLFMTVSEFRTPAGLGKNPLLNDPNAHRASGERIVPQWAMDAEYWSVKMSRFAA